MMDELELLKQDWQRKDRILPRLSYDEIHRMIWKRSSSLVRWIFYISIIEFLLPHLLYLIPSFRSGMDLQVADQLGIRIPLLVITGIQYAGALYFIVQFYLRYREISVLDDTELLMGRILRTRTTVKHYVFFCLGMILIFFGVFIFGMLTSDNLVSALQLDPATHTDPKQLKWMVAGIMAVAALVFTAVMGCIYFLLYGLLTRKLLRNFRELKRMEN